MDQTWWCSYLLMALCMGIIPGSVLESYRLSGIGPLKPDACRASAYLMHQISGLIVHLLEIFKSKNSCSFGQRMGVPLCPGKDSGSLSSGSTCNVTMCVCFCLHVCACVSFIHMHIPLSNVGLHVPLLRLHKSPIFHGASQTPQLSKKGNSETGSTG